jgi:hypothetical protein
MTGRDLFGVILRVAGLLVVYALWNLWFAFFRLVGMAGPKDLQVSWYFAFGVPALLLGLYFLRGAPHVLRFSYPDRRDGTDGRVV